MRVTVAVVDSGWDRAQAEPRVLPGAAFLSGLADGADDHDRLGHGTACIAEVLRWAPAARVLPARVFGADAETSPEALARAIRWSAAAGAGVISLSLGTRREDARAPLEQACAAARAAGAVLVAAGPNSGPSTHPAESDQVIGVWAGRDLAAGALRVIGPMDLEAWAGVRPRLLLGGAMGTGDGTSLATAEIAGRIAALLAAGAPPDPEQLVAALARHSRERGNPG